MTRQSTANGVLEWLPHALIFGGILLSWLGLDPRQVVMCVGLLCYGVIGIVDSVKRGYHKQMSISFLRLVGQILIVIIAVGGFFFGRVNFWVVLSLILMDRFVMGRSETKNVREGETK